jgi:hypothetical protein
MIKTRSIPPSNSRTSARGFCLVIDLIISFLLYFRTQIFADKP